MYMHIIYYHSRKPTLLKEEVLESGSYLLFENNMHSLNHFQKVVCTKLGLEILQRRPMFLKQGLHSGQTASLQIHRQMDNGQ